MVEAPNNNSIDWVCLKPTFKRIFSNIFPLGKILADLFKYLYAEGFFEKIFPIKGIIVELKIL